MADKFIKIPGKNKYRTQLLTKLYQCSVLSQLENDVYLFSLLSSPGLKATVSFSDNILSVVRQSALCKFFTYWSSSFKAFGQFQIN